jgi:hypothetical protein
MGISRIEATVVGIANARLHSSDPADPSNDPLDQLSDPPDQGNANDEMRSHPSIRDTFVCPHFA